MALNNLNLNNSKLRIGFLPVAFPSRRGPRSRLAFAQEEAEEREAVPEPAELIVTTPSELELEVGDSLVLEAEVRDADGNAMDRTVVFYSRRRRAVA